MKFWILACFVLTSIRIFASAYEGCFVSDPIAQSHFNTNQSFTLRLYFGRPATESQMAYNPFIQLLLNGGASDKKVPRPPVSDLNAKSFNLYSLEDERGTIRISPTSNQNLLQATISGRFQSPTKADPTLAIIEDQKWTTTFHRVDLKTCTDVVELAIKEMN